MRGAGTPIADTGGGGVWSSRRESPSCSVDGKRRHGQKRVGTALVNSRLVLRRSSLLIKGFRVLGRPRPNNLPNRTGFSTKKRDSSFG